MTQINVFYYIEEAHLVIEVALYCVLSVGPFTEALSLVCVLSHIFQGILVARAINFAIIIIMSVGLYN